MHDKDHNATVSPTHLEPGAGNETAREDEAEAFDSPVSIHIHSVRQRLTDADAICAKWVVDELVLSGVLVDDSPAHVKELTYSQEKGWPEETIITITDEHL